MNVQRTAFNKSYQITLKVSQTDHCLLQNIPQSPKNLAVPRGCLRFVIVVFPDHTTYYFCLRCHYVHAVLTTPILRSYCVLIQPRPHYAFFEHVRSSTTSFTSTKTLLRS